MRVALHSVTFVRIRNSEPSRAPATMGKNTAVGASMSNVVLDAVSEAMPATSDEGAAVLVTVVAFSPRQ